LDNVDCNSVLEQLSEYIDSEARQELCKAIAEHMSRCQDCRVFIDTVKKTIVLYQSGSGSEIPMRATEQLRAALAREYAAEGGPARAD